MVTFCLPDVCFVREFPGFVDAKNPKFSLLSQCLFFWKFQKLMILLLKLVMFIT